MGIEEGEEKFVFDPDKLDPSLLITDVDDQNYLQSLLELHCESILGDHFDKLKNAVDMNKALREAAQLGILGTDSQSIGGVGMQPEPVAATVMQEATEGMELQGIVGKEMQVIEGTESQIIRGSFF